MIKRILRGSASVIPVFPGIRKAGITQKAFQLSLFEPDGSEVFNTGKTESSSMRYRMESSLKEDTDYCRKVTVWDENGYIETAYKMLENTKAPGWLAMADKSATTVWETYVPSSMKRPAGSGWPEKTVL